MPLDSAFLPLSASAETFTCTKCKRPFPGAHFITLVEGRTQKTRANKVLNPRTKEVEWTRPIREQRIDPRVPCRACRAQAASKARYARKKAEREEYRQTELAKCIALGIEADPALLPRVERPFAGTDPVLEVCTRVIAVTRAARREAEREGVKAQEQGLVTECNYYKRLDRLYHARLVLFEAIRAERHNDLQNYTLAGSLPRTHWRAYVSREDIDILKRLAEKVNIARPSQYGRPFTGLPRRTLPFARKTDRTGETLRIEAVVNAAWAPFIENIRLTRKASHSAMRNPHRATASRRNILLSTQTVPDKAHPIVSGDYTRKAIHTRAAARKKHGPIQYRLHSDNSMSFSMEDFHLLRVRCCDEAMEEIDTAMQDYVHPAEWVDPWTGEPAPITTWKQLVPPLMRDELVDMWRSLPESRQTHLLPFPRMTTDRRKRWQKDKGLDSNALPLPTIAPPRVVLDTLEAK